MFILNVHFYAVRVRVRVRWVGLSWVVRAPTRSRCFGSNSNSNSNGEIRNIQTVKVAFRLGWAMQSRVFLAFTQWMNEWMEGKGNEWQRQMRLILVPPIAFELICAQQTGDPWSWLEQLMGDNSCHCNQTQLEPAWAWAAFEYSNIQTIRQSNNQTFGLTQDFIWRWRRKLKQDEFE